MTRLMKIVLSFVVLVTTLLLAANTVSAGASFKDVPSNHWAHTDIYYVVTKKIMAGQPDGTFQPTLNITREQAATVIGLALKIDTENRPNPNFVDVSASDPAYPYIAALADDGVFAKVERFNPKSPLTRAEMAKVFVEGFNLTGSTSKIFSDVQKNHWGFHYVSTLLANHITTGITATTYDPSGTVTRAQMAAFVRRAMESQAYAEGLAYANEMLQIINQERAKVNVPPLKLNVAATKVAILKAQDMRDNFYFDHTSPIYGDWDVMLEDFGVPMKTSGENIAAGYRSASSAMDGFMNSPGHRDNILGSHYTSVGIGTAEGGEWGFYAVQMFIQE